MLIRKGSYNFCSIQKYDNCLMFNPIRFGKEISRFQFIQKIRKYIYNNSSYKLTPFFLELINKILRSKLQSKNFIILGYLFNEIMRFFLINLKSL
jgi:hypothetical protein